MKKIFVVLVVAIMLPLSAFAKKKPQQDSKDETEWLNAPTPDGSPTLGATRDWLKNVLDGYGGYNINGASRPIEGVQIDAKCNFTWKERYIYRLDKQNLIVHSYVMPLGALTGVSVDAGYAPDVVLRLSTGQVSAIRVTDDSGKEAYESNESIFLGRVPEAKSAQDQVPQRPSEMAPRVISALVHAADLCRSMYKAPAQAKEPF